MKDLKVEPVQFRGMRQEVSQVLRKALFDGIYEPGEQIYEAELAKQLRLSRGPVREALLQLEKESLVQNVYNRGWFVLKLTPAQISEITSLRVVLEVIALRLARDKVSPLELTLLEQVQNSMIEAYDQGDITEAIQRDFDFHRHIWTMSGHGTLNETLNKVTTPYFAYYKMSKPRSESEVTAFRGGLEHHHAMIDYLVGRTDQSAEACIRAHFAPVTVERWSVLLDAVCKEPNRR